MSRIPVALILSVLLGGCTMMSGAPTPIIKAADLDRPDSAFAFSDRHVAELLATTQVDRRNALLTHCIGLVDLRYGDFRHSLVANRKHFNAGTDFLAMLTGVASTLTESVAAKTNYAQLGVLLTGSRGLVDSNYLFGQTKLALVSQMDADRATRMSRIFTRMDGPVDVYPGLAAFQDCAGYYEAGTLLSAVIELNKAAAANARDAEEKTREELRVRASR